MSGVTLSEAIALGGYHADVALSSIRVDFVRDEHDNPAPSVAYQLSISNPGGDWRPAEGELPITNTPELQRVIHSLVAEIRRQAGVRPHPEEPHFPGVQQSQGTATFQLQDDNLK